MRLKELRDLIDLKIGSDWLNLEPETIRYELVLNDVDFDKLHILLALELTPELFVNNSLFFLHCTDVLNNNVADFREIPLPTSLEVAWAIKEIEETADQCLGFSNSIKHVVTFILKHEGYVSPTKYFEKFVTEGAFPGGDESNKEKAIGLYLKGMSNGTPD